MQRQLRRKVLSRAVLPLRPHQWRVLRISYSYPSPRRNKSNQFRTTAALSISGKEQRTN
jgi:hypothetical protein